MRAAASRTFCTAGKSNPIRMAMIAITTSSSISVKARKRAAERGAWCRVIRFDLVIRWGERGRVERGARRGTRRRAGEASYAEMLHANEGDRARFTDSSEKLPRRTSGH